MRVGLPMALRLACIIAIVLPLSAGAQGQPLRGLVGLTFPAKVVAVVDGDTIDVVRAVSTALRQPESAFTVATPSS